MLRGRPELQAGYKKSNTDLKQYEALYISEERPRKARDILGKSWRVYGDGKIMMS